MHLHNIPLYCTSTIFLHGKVDPKDFSLTKIEKAKKKKKRVLQNN